jgi:hypothetical protein
MKRLTAAAAGLACALFLAHPAKAEPSDYIFSPEVEKGEREIDSKAGLAHDRDGHSYWSASVGVEYGFTRWWAAEVTINFGRDLGQSSDVHSLEWENRFQLTHDDDADHVLGFLFELAKEKESDEGWEVRYGPLLQQSFGRLQANLNLLLERHLDAEEESHTEFAYQYQLRWRHGGGVDWGVQGFGELGRWDDWAPAKEQSHIAGPAVFARLGDDDDDPEVEAGLLLGLTNGSPRTTLRLQAMVPF